MWLLIASLRLGVQARHEEVLDPREDHIPASVILPKRVQSMKRGCRDVCRFGDLLRTHAHQRANRMAHYVA
jgi:hypothetical protein